MMAFVESQHRSFCEQINYDRIIKLPVRAVESDRQE
jgi:hypothetical protein